MHVRQQGALLLQLLPAVPIRVPARPLCLERTARAPCPVATVGAGSLQPAVRRAWLCRFYIVTYALGIYNLNLFLGFLTPQIDPEGEGPVLPSKRDEEFRPFVRKLPEFKFWWV